MPQPKVRPVPKRPATTSKPKPRQRQRQNRAAKSGGSGALDTPLPEQRERFGEWAYLTPALLLALVVFGQVAGFDFVNWDDDVNILENRAVTTMDWRAIWTETVIGNYNPLSISTFALEYALVGESARLYHVNNLLLHGACVTLVYFLGRRLELRPWAAGLLAALFAVHPMRVESVAWVTERKDVLFGALYFGAMLVYERARQAGRTSSWHSGVALLFALSLLAKIQAVSLPLSLLCLDYLRQRELRWGEVLAKAPYFVMSLVVGVAGVLFLGRDGSLTEATDYTFFDRLAVGAYAYVVYLVKAIVPYEHSALYPYPATLPLRAYLSLPLALGVVGLMVLGWRRGWVRLTFALALFSVNVVFMLQVLGAGQGFLADRFTYVGYVGLFWGLAYGAQRLSAGRWGAPVRWGVAAYVLLLAGLAFRYTGAWRDGDALWAHVAERYPGTGTAYGNRGLWLRERGQTAEALALFTEAIAADPRSGAYLNSRGKLHFDEGRTAEAIADYTLGLEREPELAELLVNRGAAYAKTGQYAAAESDLDAGLAMAPDNFNGYLNRSLLYYTTGRINEAIADYDRLLRMRPERHDLWHERGTLLLADGRVADGHADIETAIRLAGPGPEARRYRASLPQ